MFITKKMKSVTRTYNEKCDHFKNTKNGKPNEFKPQLVKIHTWENDPKVERKGTLNVIKQNFQDEIDNALSRTISVFDKVNSESLNTINNEQFTDMSELQHMNKTDLIDQIKETKKNAKKNMISKAMESGSKHNNTSHSANDSSNTKEKENTQCKRDTHPENITKGENNA